MATGAFFAALGYRLWVKAGTVTSTVPTASTGLVEVLSLDNAGIQGQTDTTDVIDYASSLGFKSKLVTGQSYTLPLSMNLSLNDAGYLELRNAWQNSGTGTTVQWYRESPEMSATGNPQIDAGVAFVTNFQEDIQAGNVAKVSFTLEGVGAPSFTAETNA